MQNKDSQRGAEVEVLETIGNLIAAYSHHSEIYNSLQVDLQHRDDYPVEIASQMEEESMRHYQKMEEVLEERRKAMRILKNMAKEYDDKMHCLMKHSIAIYQFSQELLNTDMSNLDYIELAEHASQYMYECASKYLGVDLVTCGRCLKDLLDDDAE